MRTTITGSLTLPSISGQEISPDVIALSEPVPRPDLGPNAMACLANVAGRLCVIELSVKFVTKDTT